MNSGMGLFTCTQLRYTTESEELLDHMRIFCISGVLCSLSIHHPLSVRGSETSNERTNQANKQNETKQTTNHTNQRGCEEMQKGSHAHMKHSPVFCEGTAKSVSRLKSKLTSKGF